MLEKCQYSQNIAQEKKINGCSWARPMGWKIKYKIPDFTASEDLPLTKIQID